MYYLLLFIIDLSVLSTDFTLIFLPFKLYKVNVVLNNISEKFYGIPKHVIDYGTRITYDVFPVIKCHPNIF